MPIEVGHPADDERPFPVLRLAGALDDGGVSTVRSALLSTLAHQPAALIVDVADVRLDDPAAARVFRDVASLAADWPAAALMLVSPQASAWHTTGLPVHPSVPEALAGMDLPAVADRLDAELDPVVGAARVTRQIITDACRRWAMPDLAGSACIVATEMVNNGVAHARTGMTLLLSRRADPRGDQLQVAVRDHSRAAPTFTGPVPPESYGGRGLVLIDSVADRWGCLPLDDGKVVWAVLWPESDIPPPGADPHRTGMAEPGRG
ncbi:ATP-binding protein [Mangrovihabitans endophyticus]|uniref:STAS domain-containing protein n=1 Tax=Mangrovihabitans endophyticus TaxID=1751298 RepID=A0A8J3FQX8_9ACTN|nr:ATP-binding protein [Mangrovihabitans endophyticus]GGL01660.1 hypothetical protein GCM10012284_40300 [Mangrovihabitans endophyticus]